MEYEASKNEGNEAMKKENYIEALIHYTKAISMKPDIATLYGNRSKAFLKIQQYYHALEDANRLVSMMPSWSKAYFRRGQVYLETEHFSEAMESFKKALSMDTADETIQEYLNKATVGYQQQRQREHRLPWLGGLFGFIICCVIILIDETVAAHSPILQSDVIRAVALVVISGVCIGFAMLYRYMSRSQRHSLLEEPIDLLPDTPNPLISTPAPQPAGGSRPQPASSKGAKHRKSKAS